MEQYNELFQPILDDDEVIEKVYKPKKVKMFVGNLIATFFCLLFFCGGLAVGLLSPDEETGELLPRIVVLIPIGIFVLSMLIASLFVGICYKKTVYAVTNKRVIIRTGIIGIDYKSLDMAMIGAIDVYVGLIDKILRKNTGTIRYGSTSSPMNAQNGSMYAFKHIEDPYKNCKEIKVAIDAYKKNKTTPEQPLI